MAVESGLSHKQLRDWFRNERKRVWLPFWQSLLSDDACAWACVRVSGGRANILPRTLAAKYEGHEDFDIRRIAAAERSYETGEPLVLPHVSPMDGDEDDRDDSSRVRLSGGPTEGPDDAESDDDDEGMDASVDPKAAARARSKRKRGSVGEKH